MNEKNIFILLRYETKLDKYDGFHIIQYVILQDDRSCKIKKRCLIIVGRKRFKHSI